MALTDNPEVNVLIDRLCAQGCTVVQEHILALERGTEQPTYAHLDAAGRRLLLTELRAIMAVYGD
ncbi:MAG TPA: hypothetical protein VK971_00515 [Thiohalobacter sp.]|nr:hypothetical protein [Thiohalobacter sp.]